MEFDIPALKVMKAAKEAYEAALQSAGKEAIATAAKLFFDRHPTVYCIAWNQGTPGFNDGDPCVFVMHEPVLQIVDPNDLTTPRFGSHGFKGSIYDLTEIYSVKDEPLKSDARDLSRLLQRDLKKLCEDVFGDPTQVVITREGIILDEFNPN